MDIFILIDIAFILFLVSLICFRKIYKKFYSIKFENELNKESVEEAQIIIAELKHEIKELKYDKNMQERLLKDILKILNLEMYDIYNDQNEIIDKIKERRC